MIDKLAPPRLRDVSPAIIQELARSVSKVGSLELSENELDAVKAAGLSDEEIVMLYVYIRDASSRLEDEWRDEFVDAFPELEAILPTPQA